MSEVKRGDSARADSANYRRVRVEKSSVPDESKPLNEIRISAKGRRATYIAYASTLFAATNPAAENDEDKEKPKVDPKNNKPFETITFKGTGAALDMVVTVVEIIKRRFKNVDQITKIGSFEIEDDYVPINEEAGLEPMKQKRSVSFIEIILSRQPGLLDKKALGYQPPVPESEVTEMTVEEMLNPKSRKDDEDNGGGKGGKKKDGGSGGKRGGKGGKGKGKKKGGGKGKRSNSAKNKD